jgi:ABC-type hemin transport system ATPase subunit
MLKLENITVTRRLESVSLELQAGQMVCLLGANGAGKSSLLSVVSGLLHTTSGLTMINDKDINAYSASHLASFRCYQEQQSISHFELTVEDALSFFSTTTEIPERLDKALEISQFAKRKLNTLSGGESRRVHIARVLLQIWPAIINGTGLILLDEPIQGLDFKHQHLIFKLLQEFASAGNLVLLSHHDLNLANRYSDRVLLMLDGKVIANGAPNAEMNKTFLEQAFGCKIDCIEDQFNNRLFQSYL